MERKYIETEELKRIQLDILDQVAAYCQKYGLRYYLGYGTLIGAIRHKGYIPWDDDIDIIMPRPDYDRLLQGFNRPGQVVRVIDYTLDRNYTVPFAKVYDTRTDLYETMYRKSNFGVYIDVFPLDGYQDASSIPRCKLLSKMLNTKMAVLDGQRSMGKNLVMALGKILLLPVSVEAIIRKYQQLATRYPYDESEMVNSMFSPYCHKELCRKDLLQQATTCKFEGRTYSVPARYDTYLRMIYGDYMQLPPLEKRVTHHTFVAWWK